MARTAMQTFLYSDRTRSRTHAFPWAGTELVGRVFLAAIFMLSGIAKFADPSGTAEHMAAQGIPAVSILLPLAALAEIVGGLSLISGALARAGALMLIGFLIPTTFIFHDFWNLEGGERVAQMASFMKNVGLIGGLLLLLAHGAGRLSVDHRLARRQAIH